MDGPGSSESSRLEPPELGFRILDSLAVPLFRCDRNGQVTYCNRSALGFFGQDVQGTDAARLLSPEIPGTDLDFTELLSSVVERHPAELGHVALVLQRPDGYRREVISRLTYDPESERVTCIVLPGVHSLLRALARVARSAMHASHVDATLMAITSEACRLLNATRSYVLYWDTEDVKPTMRALTPSDAQNRVSGLDSLPRGSLVYKAHKEGRVLSTRQFIEETNVAVVSPFANTLSQVAAPLFSEEQPGVPQKLGVLVVEGDRSGQFGLDDESVLETLAVHGSIAIAHARLLVEVNSTYEELIQSMPERVLIRNLIHDAKNLVRDAAGTVEKIANGKKKATDLEAGLDGLNDIADILADALKRLRRQSPPASYHRERVDLIPLINRVRRILLHSAADIKVSPENAKDSYEVFGDPSQVLTIVYNLAANSVGAIKASGKGGTITISVSHTPGQTASRRVEIKDTGPGMDNSVRYLVRSGESVSRTVGGSGIGLVSIRELVTELGGSIDVQSSVGGGTRFMIDLPGPEERK
jgi:signal transduction histidine kinase